MTSLLERSARVRRAVAAAARLADPGDPLGRRARELLPASTGLSPEGVELALTDHLETAPSDAEVESLIEHSTPTPRAHVLLSANVFVAAHRAIAIGLAASEHVQVRASRREPEMARLLAQAGAPIELVTELAPSPGEHVWAYGSAATLDALRAELPPGVFLHEHGPGIGVAWIDAASSTRLEHAARALARDVVPFDQRGCLSPRLALVHGGAEHTREFAVLLASALAELGLRVPRGRLSDAERADEQRYRDAAAYAYQLLEAGDGAVSVDTRGAVDSGVLVPPVGRNVHVVLAGEPSASLHALASVTTCVGVAAEPALARAIAAALPRVRVCALGCMQRPPFDGPVDRRERITQTCRAEPASR